MDWNQLIWTEESRREVFKSPVFTVQENTCRAPDGGRGVFTTLEAADWAIVVPVIETGKGREFIMVRQWRHGARELSLEFPGGVFEAGEDGSAAAARELWEETAYRAGRILKLGEMNPNPAIMTNRVHFFLAGDLQNTGQGRLDRDEFITVESVPEERVLGDMGRPPFIHALMASAAAFYLQYRAGPKKPPRGNAAGEL
jgi:8-oxo-dGTP pyrophosphatase MutT (NUDIX family)